MITKNKLTSGSSPSRLASVVFFGRISRNSSLVSSRS